MGWCIGGFVLGLLMCQQCESTRTAYAFGYLWFWLVLYLAPIGGVRPHE